MFIVYQFRYIDKESKLGFVFYCRTVSFADSLANRISVLGIYNLRKARIGFCKKYVTDTPPYELEQAQEEYVEGLEEKALKRSFNGFHSGS